MLHSITQESELKSVIGVQESQDSLENDGSVRQIEGAAGDTEPLVFLPGCVPEVEKTIITHDVTLNSDSQFNLNSVVLYTYSGTLLQSHGSLNLFQAHRTLLNQPHLLLVRLEIVLWNSASAQLFLNSFFQKFLFLLVLNFPSLLLQLIVTLALETETIPELLKLKKKLDKNHNRASKVASHGRLSSISDACAIQMKWIFPASRPSTLGVKFLTATTKACNCNHFSINYFLL